MYFRVTDPLKREICLPRDSWEHIQDRHPEFTVPKSVEITINTPNVIVPSLRKPDRDVYYKIGALGTYPPLYVAVIVGFSGGEGQVITAHLSDTIKVGPGGYKYVHKK